MRLRSPSFSRVACDACCLIAILTVALGTTTLRAAQVRVSYNDKYGVIEDRNVFVKDRTHIVRGGPTSRPGGDSAPKRSAEESFVLTGVVAEDGGYRAYVENIDTSNVMRVAVGDSLHKGKVSAIETDAIAYDPSGGQRIWVEIGSDLTGKPSAALSARAAEESSTATVASDIANINPNDPNLTIEQKMKLRRAQQMGTPVAPAAAPGAPGAPGAPAGAPGATTQPQQQQQQPPQQQQQQQPSPSVIVVPPEAFQQSGQP